MSDTKETLFQEQYRVVAVEGESLTIRGESSGKILTIMNPDPNTPLTLEEYPPGKLIVLSDPADGVSN